MKGSLKTVIRVSDNNLSKTNFNDWSDPKYKLPVKKETKISKSESSEQLKTELKISDKSLKSVESQTAIDYIEIRDKIKAGHPLMTRKEIRDYRLPFHESLLLTLKEEGFFLTHEFIKDLISVDDAYHKDLETDFSLKHRPILKLTKPVLIPLSKGLMKAETSRLNIEKNQEATAFLQLAILFSKAGDSSWYWIALEMFEQCMEVMKSVDHPVDLQLQATAKYLYGLFLFQELHELNEAKDKTECSMKISEGKNWTVNDTKEKKGNTVYAETCILLHDIYLEMARREMLSDNSDEAIHCCRNALLWAKVVNNKLAEAVALQKLINIYLTVQQLFSVPELLQSYMKLCTELENFEGLCEGYILYAKFHDSVGETMNVIEDMKNLLRVAKENNITKMVAMAHHKLATYSMMKKTDKEFLQHAIEAYVSYLNLKKNIKDIDEARCMVGVAQALEIMPEYCELLFEAENNNLVEQTILLRWKNLRIPFFDKEFVFIPQISANTDFLNRVEGKRTEELIAHVHRRQSDLVTLTSKKTSDFRSRLASLTSPPASDSVFSDPSQFSRDKSSLRESNFQRNLTLKNEEANKFRAVSFLQDGKESKSASM